MLTTVHVMMMGPTRVVGGGRGVPVVGSFSTQCHHTSHLKAVKLGVIDCVFVSSLSRASW